MRRLPPLLLALAIALSGCGVLGIGGAPTPSTLDRVARERTVDPAAAAALINAHRAARGLSPLVVDGELNAIAAETAQKLARRDRLMTSMHTPSGLGRRLAGRVSAERAAENLGAGYPTLALTVEGWKKSAHHNENLLNGELTHMGIGLALTEKGQFHSYWVLIMAKPDPKAS
jgi:uncharacterized protein YkwD